MSRPIQLIYFLILTFILFSCTPSVRFTSINKKSSSNLAEQKKRFEGLNPNEKKEKIVEIAEEWLGVPYQYGGNSIDGVDCSAFVQNVYSELGECLPRTAREQYEATDKVNANRKEVGDLVFFRKSSDISHVGIYVGNNQIIHASTSRGVVKESLQTEWLEKVFAGVGRVPK